MMPFKFEDNSKFDNILCTKFEIIFFSHFDSPNIHTNKHTHTHTHTHTHFYCTVFFRECHMYSPWPVHSFACFWMTFALLELLLQWCDTGDELLQLSVLLWMAGKRPEAVRRLPALVLLSCALCLRVIQAPVDLTRSADWSANMRLGLQATDQSLRLGELTTQVLHQLLQVRHIMFSLPRVQWAGATPPLRASITICERCAQLQIIKLCSEGRNANVIYKKLWCFDKVFRK